MPSLKQALEGLSVDQRAVIEILLRQVEQGELPEERFWTVWSELTGRPVPGEASEAARPWPGDLHPDTLPTWLAHPWTSLCQEAHARVQLHWLVDTAELVVRWTVAVALAEVLHARGGVLPPEVLKQIAEHIERPTLGRWLAILHALGEAAPEATVVTDGLFDWARVAVPDAFRKEERGGTPEMSLLVLRNHLAHGGGVSERKARELLDAQLARLVGLLEGLRTCLGATRVVSEGKVLLGTAPTAAGPELAAHPRGQGARLVRGEVSLALEPLALHAPVRHVGADGQLHEAPGGAAPQMFTRALPDRITYTPFGCEAFHADHLDVARFREIFRLDAGSRAHGSSKQARPFAWDDFLREARVQAEGLVGRGEQLRTAKAWLKKADPRDPNACRIGWVGGEPGIGKSLLLAKLASDFENPQHRGLFLHRFRGGDARNNRRSFLQLLQGALLAWEPLARVAEPPAPDATHGQALEDDVRDRLEALAGLQSPHPQAPPPTFWIFVDGLDEVVSTDRGIPDLITSLALPGTLWLVTSRPEKDLGKALVSRGAEEVFPGGLPGMTDLDIRAMLAKGLGVGRHALIRRDEDRDGADGADGRVYNPFVEAVVERADGLPLYVHLLLEDLRKGHFTVEDESRLPAGLVRYYDELLARLGIGDVVSDLTSIVALLSQAEEPLDAWGLALLLSGDVDLVAEYRPRVEAALRVGATLLRRAPGPDSSDAWTLYHQSFREHVDRTPAMEGSVKEARRRLARAAAAWPTQTAPELAPVRAHLFRRGTTYALAWLGDAGAAAVRSRLTDFAYLQARTAALPASACTDLAQEYARLLAASTSADPDLVLWEAFLGERVHLLLRGDADWPANRILLQLAVEHADDSPVTQAAEAWLETGACDWVWLRRAGRPERAVVSGCLRVLEGHRHWVGGAMALSDGRVLSWALDGTLLVWDLKSGVCLATLEGHTAGVTHWIRFHGSS